MKITSKILHLPPFITTSWMHIRALYTKNDQLVITLMNNDTLTLPALPTEILTLIFDGYAAFLEENQNRLAPLPFSTDSNQNPYSRVLPLNSQNRDAFLEGKHFPIMKMNLNSIDSIAESMQHDMALRDSPDIPKEILEKIAEITRIVASEDIEQLPKAEPHCNCPHCQIARAIHEEPEREHLSHALVDSNEIKEEQISADDLKFEQWDIKKTGESLYSVTNRLDPIETFNVYLGEPVGCTCGSANCEHIVAVLKT